LTAATLWGSQEKIKNGVVLVKTKVEEYLTKKRKARLKLKSVSGSSPHFYFDFS
jgi:hypothetical protein